MTEKLRLEYLGGMQIIRAETPLTRFVSVKAPALLCYLAVTGRPQFRLVLAGLLWGDLPEEDACANLRKVLSNAMDYQAITFICELTEGLPLAIELAAAWTKSMSCLEIAQAVESSLDALTTFQTDWSPRHRSIRAAFDHSWTLLSAVERDAFQRVATFPADFDRETALRITAVDLPLLTALTDKSLLRRNPDGRYEMHELLRLFAREKGTRSSQQLALNML